MTILFRRGLFDGDWRRGIAGHLIRIQIEDQRSARPQIVTPDRDLFAKRIEEGDLARAAGVVWVEETEDEIVIGGRREWHRGEVNLRVLQLRRIGGGGPIVERRRGLPAIERRAEQVARMHRLAAARAQANFHSAPKALSPPSRSGDQLARRDDRRPHRRRGQTQRYAIGADCPPRRVVEINLVVSRISAVLMPTRAGEGIGGQNDLGMKAALGVFDDKGRANIEPARNVIFRRFSEEASNRRERIGRQRGEGARESREKTAAIEWLHRSLHWGSGS